MGAVSQSPGSTAFVDLRPQARFEAGHAPSAAGIPLEEMTARIHELPPPEEPLVLYDEKTARAESGRALLLVRGRTALTVHRDTGAPPPPPLEQGPSRIRLWRPHALLVEALPIIRSAWGALDGRRAVDLACGMGRECVSLALAGLDAEGVDVLPDAVERAADLARRNGVRIRTRLADIEKAPDLEPGAYDLVTVFRFLHRPLFPAIREAVRPGGFVIYQTFLVAQREQYGKPRRDGHLLLPGELRGAFEGWRVRIDREGPSAPRAITATLLAQRPC